MHYFSSSFEHICISFTAMENNHRNMKDVHNHSFMIDILHIITCKWKLNEKGRILFCGQIISRNFVEIANLLQAKVLNNFAEKGPASERN